MQRNNELEHTMRNLLLVIFLSIIAVFSAVMHEQDLYSNCREYGNAHAWFVDITCEEMKR